MSGLDLERPLGYFCMRQNVVTLSLDKNLEANMYHHGLWVIKLWGNGQSVFHHEIILIWNCSHVTLRSLSCSVLVLDTVSWHKPISEPDSFPLFLLASIRSSLQHLSSLQSVHLFLYRLMVIQSSFSNHCELIGYSKVYSKKF